MKAKSIFNTSSDLKIKSMIQPLQIVLDNLPCAFSIIDPVRDEKDEIIDFIFAYANSIALTDLGLQGVEIFDKKITGIFPQSSEVLINTCNKALVDENSHNIHIHGNIKGSGKRRVKKVFDAVITKADTVITLSWKCVGPHKKEVDNFKVEEVVRIPKQEYDTLRKSEELFSKTFYLSPDAYIISRMTDCKILQINNSTEILFGYSKSEIIGKTSNQLGLFADLKDRENAVDLLNENGALRDFSTVIERKSGEKQQVSLAIEVMTIENEKYVLKSVRDISERKRIEDALCESEKRYRTTLDNMMEGCAIIGFDWTYLYINNVYSQHAHKKQEELIGRNLLEVFPGVENSEFFYYYKICMEERFPQHIEASFTFDDGLTAWYQAIVQPVPEGIFSLSIDITERKKAEDELKRSKEILTLILDHINEGIIVSDAPDGKIAAISRWGINHTIGRSVDAVIDLPVEHYLEQWDVRDIKTGKEIEPERLPVARALIGETIKSEEWLMLRPDGTSFVTSVNAVPIYDERKNKIISAVATWVDITERKNAEETINTRMIELETVLDSIADGVIIYDTKGKIVRSNAAANEILKYPQIDREATMHERIKERYGVWSEDGHKLTPEEMPAMRALNFGETVKGILLKVQGAGEPRWVNVSAAPLFVAGKQIGVVASLSDITERKKAEETVIITKEQYELLFNSIGEGFALYKSVYDENHILNDLLVLEINPAGAAFSGVKREDQIGKTWKQVWTGIEDSLFDIYREIDLKGEPYVFEHFSGITKRWYINRIYKVADARFAVTFLDITERKKAEETVKESEAKLLDAQKLAHMGNYTVDIKSNSIEWSEELYDIWELEKNKPIPSFEELWNRVHPDDREQVKKVLEREIMANDKVETELRLVFPNNRIKYVQLVTRGIFDEAGNLLKRQGVEIDITERKEAMLRLERTLRELERSNADLERFAFAASHDLQEPIRMIGSYAQLITKRYEGKLSPEADMYLKFMFEGAQRLQLLVKDMLYYSQLRTYTKRNDSIDLNELIKQILVEFNKIISETNALITTNQMPVITGDHAQIQQLFQNLISNAIKFRKKDVRSTISLSCDEKDSEWLFAVKDNGIGIEKKYINLIFTAFKRLNDREIYPGIGFGLAICRRIVERHGGKIWVESEPGTGSIFYFTISKSQGLL